MGIANPDGSIVLTTQIDTKDIKKQVAKLAAEYRKAGMSQSEAFKKAWSEIERTRKETEKATQATETYGKKAKNAFQTLGETLKSVAGYLALAFSVTKIIQFSSEAGEMATQTEASVQRLVDIYGTASEKVGDFIDANARALGMSKAAASSFSSVYGNLFSVWADQETNAELTNSYLNMTAVIASKTGRTVADVQERIRSGLLGNTEAIEDLGVFVNVKTIEMTDAFQRMANGRSWEQLDAYTQQQVRSIAILEQATAKYGNQVDNTSATIRNRYRAAYEDFKNSWGNIVNRILIPILQVVTQIFDIITIGLNVLLGRSGKTLENAQIQEKSSEKTASNINAQAEGQKKLNKEMQKTLAGFDEATILSSGGAGSSNNISDIETPSSALDIPEIDGMNSLVGFKSEISETLLGIMGIVGETLIAVGLILLFTGNIAWGIGFIIAGAGTVSVTIATASSFNYSGIVKMLASIMAFAGSALLAIGIMLLYIGGVVGKGVAIGMIIAGASLIVGAVASQIALAPEDVQSWLTLIMAIAAGALLALGVIMCMLGSVPLGIGLIAAGVISIVSAVVINTDTVVDLIKSPLGAVIAIVGGALLAIGIILVCTGAALPLGIALIAAGAVSLITPIALNAKAIVEWISNIWQAIKNFWNANIAHVFTYSFWASLAKKCANGLISGFEWAVNGIISIFETMINWIVDGLNKISFDVPDWVPLIGGKTFGFDIPEVDFGRVSIPRLATGTVVPPNKRFIAELGDNTREHEVVSPLSTIKQAVSEVLDGEGGFAPIHLAVYLDSKIVYETMVERNNENTRRTGVNAFA